MRVLRSHMSGKMIAIFRAEFFFDFAGNDSEICERSIRDNI